MTRLSQVQFHNGGYCVQLGRMAGADSWKPRQFHAVFVSFVHPIHGLCLIDTGYGPATRDANRSFAGMLMSILLPIPRRQVFDEPNYPNNVLPFTADDVQRVFISHFHADHIGGLSLFPKSTWVYRDATLRGLLEASWTSRLHHGFFPQLLTDALQTQCDVIEETMFQHSDAEVHGFLTYDYFGDGSLILVDMPGHALGHTGYLLRTSNLGEIFYVVDACWDMESWACQRSLPWISRALPQDHVAYQQTQEKMRRMAASFPGPLLACHCPLTQAYVA